MNLELENRLREIWHVTSLSTAEVILSSGKIWGGDYDGAANFHPLPSSANEPTSKSEISLRFHWEGEIQLRTKGLKDLKPGVMYVFVSNETNSLSELTVDDAKVWACKIPRGTNEGLTCINAVSLQSTDAEHDEKMTKLLTACQRGISITVPTTAEINKLMYEPKVRTSRHSVLNLLWNKLWSPKRSVTLKKN